MKDKNIVRIVKVSETEDAIVIKVERPRCRKCKEPLHGGEIDFGICDDCDDGSDAVE